MNLTNIVESALGVVLGFGLVGAAWVLLKAVEFFWTFTKAAAQTRVEIVCERKKP